MVVEHDSCFVLTQAVGLLVKPSVWRVAGLCGPGGYRPAETCRALVTFKNFAFASHYRDQVCQTSNRIAV